MSLKIKRIHMHKREESDTDFFYNITKADKRIGTNVPPGFHCPQWPTSMLLSCYLEPLKTTPQTNKWLCDQQGLNYWHDRAVIVGIHVLVLSWYGEIQSAKQRSSFHVNCCCFRVSKTLCDSPKASWSRAVSKQRSSLELQLKIFLLV